MDREDRIKHMFYDWDKERKVILDIQKCQRNWDHDKWFKINKELIITMINCSALCLHGNSFKR